MTIPFKYPTKEYEDEGSDYDSPQIQRPILVIFILKYNVRPVYPSQAVHPPHTGSTNANQNEADRCQELSEGNCLNRYSELNTGVTEGEDGEEVKGESEYSVDFAYHHAAERMEEDKEFQEAMDIDSEG